MINRFGRRAFYTVRCCANCRWLVTRVPRPSRRTRFKRPSAPALRFCSPHARGVRVCVHLACNDVIKGRRANNKGTRATWSELGAGRDSLKKNKRIRLFGSYTSLAPERLVRFSVLTRHGAGRLCRRDLFASINNHGNAAETVRHRRTKRPFE